MGDRDPARKTQGQTSVAAMNLMGYDAMTLGPKELALDLDVLRQRIAEAEFAVLSANAVVSASGKLLAAPYIVRQIGGHTVAIIGLSGGGGSGEITVADPLQTAETVVAQVASQADVIILLSHAGPAVDQHIAERVPGIDVIISGGTEYGYGSPLFGAGGVLLVHADQTSPGHAGRQIGIARLTFDAQGQLTTQQWQRLTLRPEVIAEDPSMAQWVQQVVQPQANP